MKATLSRAAKGRTAVPVWFGFRSWSKLPFLLLPGLLLLAGCKDRSMEKQVTDAKNTVASLELKLGGATKEIDSLKTELKAVKQTRDELQEQMDKIKQERDQALGLSQQAREVITNLSAKADNQAGATASLEKQLAQLKALVQEQQKTIEDLQKGATAQPAGETETSGEAKDKTPPPAEPNEKP